MGLFDLKQDKRGFVGREMSVFSTNKFGFCNAAETLVINKTGVLSRLFLKACSLRGYNKLLNCV